MRRTVVAILPVSRHGFANCGRCICFYKCHQSSGLGGRAFRDPDAVGSFEAFSVSHIDAVARADLLSLSFLALPQFLRESGYVNPTDPRHTAFNLGMHTDQDFFCWLQSHPKDLEIFSSWMSAQRDTHPNFLDVIDFEQDLASGAEDSTVLFVDVGGSRGQQSIALRNRYPSLPGRIIVQDLAGVVAEATEHPLPGFQSIEAQAHDMFTPQPIQGAPS